MRCAHGVVRPSCIGRRGPAVELWGIVSGGRGRERRRVVMGFDVEIPLRWLRKSEHHEGKVEPGRERLRKIVDIELSGWKAANFESPKGDGTAYILIQEACSREQRPHVAQSSAAVALSSRLSVYRQKAQL